MTHSFRADRDSVGFARRAVVAYAQEHTDGRTDDIALAVSEALTNSVVHGYVAGRPVGIVAVRAERRRDGRLEVTVSDNGGGTRAGINCPGLGLALVACLTERLEVGLRESGGVRVRMVFAAPNGFD